MIKLINGECINELKKIPGETIDCVITDPPYGMNYQIAWRSDRHDKILNDGDVNFLDDIVLQYERVLKRDSFLLVFCSHHNIDKFKQSIEKHFKIKNILVWVKNNHTSGDLKGSFANKTEFIIIAAKGRPLIRGKRDDNVLFYKRTDNKLHPTQKPVDLIEYLLIKTTDQNDTILDSFMGSGSTGLACLNTKRNFVGIEIDKKYFNVAQKRLTGEP